jgi:hypothetical protein
MCGCSCGAPYSRNVTARRADRLPLPVEVDGESFPVHQDPQQAGTYHYDWVSGPNTGYGFTSAFASYDELSDRTTYDHQPTLDEHVAGIHNFLEQVDPDTGYIEDD